MILIGCTNKNITDNTKIEEKPTIDNSIKKEINKTLPTIGILIFEGVIINEVVAPLDVFSQTDKEGKHLFNVILLAKENKTYTSAHGLQLLPDYTFEEYSKLDVLVVPSSYHPEKQTSDKELITFIKQQNKTVDYMASHCAGAFLIGESGIATGKKIVTYYGGGEDLQTQYPNLNVLDDNLFSVVEDEKLISSNGSLVSYIASFDLLEKLTSKEHRKFVESSILFDRLIDNR
jgi:transcriptional regulator GlxA family with amidase domain